MMRDYKIINASIDDIKLMLSWAKQEGWNPGLSDHIPFHVADPKGFLVGYLCDVPIACISAVRYPDQFGFIGFYIVKPEYRKKGLGFSIWKEGMSYLSGYNIGLDGVVSEQSNYQKSGFKLAHRNIRYQGSAPQMKSLATKDLRTLPFNIIANFDRKVFPSKRDSFLSAWLNVANQGVALVEKDKLMGYGIIRKCYEGFKIGPLFAENRKIAEAILLGLCQQRNQEAIFIDIPECHLDAIQMVEHFHFKPVFETARMYSQQTPEIDLSKVFGITSFELG